MLYVFVGLVSSLGLFRFEVFKAQAIVEAKKNESAHVHHNWVRILALIPCSVAAANLLSVQLDLSIQLSISLSIQL